MLEIQIYIIVTSRQNDKKISIIGEGPHKTMLPFLLTGRYLKGHGNVADFLGFLHKSVWHMSLTLHFEPLRFGFKFAEIFLIENRLPELGSRQDCL